MRGKVNKELKIGSIMVIIYLLWGAVWLLYQNIFKGSIQRPYIPETNLKTELFTPGQESFFLGTDIYGRSVLEILSSGVVYSITVALLVSFMACAIGVIVGYLTIRGNKIFSKICDLTTNLIFIFPSILIAILIMSLLGQSMWGLIFCLVVTGWPAYARIASGETKRVFGLDFVEGAKAIGMTEFKIFYRVVFPNILPVMMIHFVLGLGGVIISEATLGFLGLGGSEYSWGALLSMSKTVLLEAPHLVVILSITMAGLIIGLNLFGDGLRDYLDPKSA